MLSVSFFEVASYIFRKAEWSLLRATSLTALTCLGFIPLATLRRMVPSTFNFLLELVIEFSLIYLLVWVFLLENEKDIEQLNQN
ncbi:MAG: DUF3021 family protein [Streptococcus sp.]